MGRVEKSNDFPRTVRSASLLRKSILDKAGGIGAAWPHCNIQVACQRAGSNYIQQINELVRIDGNRNRAQADSQAARLKTNPLHGAEARQRLSSRSAPDFERREIGRDVV